MEGDALRGHLELLLLAALARREQHGYALIEWLRAQSAGALDLGEGSVYPALRRLEAAGCATSPGARMVRAASASIGSPNGGGSS